MLLVLLFLRCSIAVLVGIGDTAFASPPPPPPVGGKSSVLVVGSANADTFLPVARLPTEGENLTLLPGTEPTLDIPGGKGCTQAVAMSKLLRSSSTKCFFIGQLGLDSAGKMLRSTMEQEGVDCSHCGFHPHLSSGRGYVFLQAQTGSVSAVVSGGSNAMGWAEWETAWDERRKRSDNHLSVSVSVSSSIDEKASSRSSDLEDRLERLLEKEGVRCVLLQREVPECVNLLIASCVKDHNNNKQKKKILVFQDVGGEDRPITKEMLELCDYIVPNESELKRLVESSSPTLPPKRHDGDDDDDDQRRTTVARYARHLQRRLGARNVLVTMGASGSYLSEKHGDGSRFEPAVPCGEEVVDETGAGDCYRAAFALALVEDEATPEEAMGFASAAGSCSVRVKGAVPSTPDRERIAERLKSVSSQNEVASAATPGEEAASGAVLPRGGGESRCRGALPSIGTTTNKNDARRPAFVGRGGSAGGGSAGGGDPVFPFLIGSRLNSMKDRPDLWHDDDETTTLATPRDYVKRQGTIRGLTCVDFNYPQHFGSAWGSNREAREALEEAGLVAGSVCLRYPSRFARGAMNHPDPELRNEAIRLTKEAAEVATELGCDEVVVWSAFDGYDYPFQVDYDEKWDQLVDAFRELCDSYPSIKFSLEYKPTDENTRFFTVPTTGAALMLVEEIDRPNMGLTLDVGHMLMAGENPGQSIAMVGRKGKLFGIQLNDGFTRLAAEDGLMFGSVHPSVALEIMYQLYKTEFRGHFYFDTFPQRSDPVREAEYNIKQVKRFWHAASEGIDESRLEEIHSEHDAIGALELVDDALWTNQQSRQQ